MFFGFERLLMVCLSAGLSSAGGYVGHLNFGAEYPPICDSQIYCHGELLHDVQIAGVFNDSKSFVDLKLKIPEPQILEEYGLLKEKNAGQLTRDQIQRFIESYFEPTEELEAHAPSDWREHPKILDQISNKDYRDWALNLNMFWKAVARKIKHDVLDHPDLYSMLYLPNPLVIPGGRFKEVYYWDTYWIVYGLLACEMGQTARGMIENLLHLVQRWGYVPNGNRKYYHMRSQPPMLIPMADAYLKFNQADGLKLINDYFEVFEMEFLYWVRNKMVGIRKNGKIYYLAHYTTRSKGPRPESYKEDFDLAAEFPSKWQRDIFYNQIKTAAETGWDFSSRHIIYNGTNGDHCKNIKYWNEQECIGVCYCDARCFRKREL